MPVAVWNMSVKFLLLLEYCVVSIRTNNPNHSPGVGCVIILTPLAKLVNSKLEHPQGVAQEALLFHFGSRRLVRERISAASIRFRTSRCCSEAFVAVHRKYYNKQFRSQPWCGRDYYLNPSGKACLFESGAPIKGSSGGFVFSSLW